MAELTEERVRQIAREEILDREIQKIKDRVFIDSLAKELSKQQAQKNDGKLVDKEVRT